MSQSFLKAVYVPVGEFRLSRDRELFSVTGSCVALCLQDTGIGLAGMVHVLVPRSKTADGRPTCPDDTDTNGHPIKDPSVAVAGSGAERLIREMLAAGAARERLTAVMVGGAGGGPEPSFRQHIGTPAGEGEKKDDGQKDEVGSENIAAVAAVLSRENIRIIRRETGGSASRRIRVRPVRGGISVERLGPADNTDTASASAAALVARRMARLSPAPWFARELIGLLRRKGGGDPLGQWGRIRSLTERDTILHLHTFRYLNSPYHGLPGELDSLEAARRRLDAGHLRRLLVLAAESGDRRRVPENIRQRKAAVSRRGRAAALLLEREFRRDMPFSDQGGPADETLTGEAVRAAALLRSAGLLLPLAFPDDERGDLSASSGASSHMPSAYDDELWLARAMIHWSFPRLLVYAVSGGRVGTPPPGAGPAAENLAQRLSAACPLRNERC